MNNDIVGSIILSILVVSTHTVFFRILSANSRQKKSLEMTNLGKGKENKGKHSLYRFGKIKVKTFLIGLKKRARDWLRANLRRKQESFSP